MGSLLFIIQIPLKIFVALHSFTHSISFCNLYGKSLGHSPFSFIIILFELLLAARSVFIIFELLLTTLSEISKYVLLISIRCDGHSLRHELLSS